MSEATTRLAMWSGPRNLSTAMMRSFENRPDTVVTDEPFYAWYLYETGIAHPGAEDIIRLGETRQDRVIDSLQCAVSAPATLHYQKHITTHVLPQLNLDWLSQVSHCFLIRDPARVVASYARKRADVVPDDLGYTVQAKLYQQIENQSGVKPLVMDADRFLKQPERHIKSMCQHFKIPYYSAMLEWPRGVRDSDGPWHKYWYHSVIESTGFIPWTPSLPALSPEYQHIADQCQSDYDTLLKLAISV